MNARLYRMQANIIRWNNTCPFQEYIAQIFVLYSCRLKFHRCAELLFRPVELVNADDLKYTFECVTFVMKAL